MPREGRNRKQTDKQTDNGYDGHHGDMIVDDDDDDYNYYCSYYHFFHNNCDDYS